MSYEEFKNIVSLLQSPDIEVVELGRQLFPMPIGWHMHCFKIWTEITYHGVSYATFCYYSSLSENYIKHLYAHIFRI